MKGDRRHCYMVYFASYDQYGTSRSEHSFCFVSNQTGTKLAKEIYGRVNNFKCADPAVKVFEKKCTKSVFDCGIVGD